MTAVRKLKLSVTLSADLVALVDCSARRSRGTRSGVVEQWLRRAASAAAEQEIDEATAAYYSSLRDDERAEDEARSRALANATRRVSYDEAPARRRPRAQP